MNWPAMDGGLNGDAFGPTDDELDLFEDWDDDEYGAEWWDDLEENEGDDI